MVNSDSTQTTPSKLSENHHRWARAYLRSPSPDPATVARMLKQADFKSVAWNTLAIRVALSPEKSTFSAVDQAMLAEAADSWAVNSLSQFAMDFFQIEVRERHAIHETFVRQNAGNPSVLAYLKHLEQGLSLDTTRYVFKNPDEQKLADYALASFVQWPPAAARMRREFAPRLVDRFHWAQVAARFQKWAPKFAIPIPDLFPVRRSIVSRMGLRREGGFPPKLIGNATPAPATAVQLGCTSIGGAVLLMCGLFAAECVHHNSARNYSAPIKPLPASYRFHFEPKKLVNPQHLTPSPVMGVENSVETSDGRTPATSSEFINADDVLRDPAEKTVQPEQAPASETDPSQPEKVPE